MRSGQVVLLVPARVEARLAAVELARRPARSFAHGRPVAPLRNAMQPERDAERRSMDGGGRGGTIEDGRMVMRRAATGSGM